MAHINVKIGADGAEFKSGIAEMRKEAQEFFGEIKESASKVGELFGVSLAAEGLKGLVEQFNEIGRQAAKFGETPESMQRIGVAARMAGTDVDSLFIAMNHLDKVIGEQSAGIKDHSRAFAMLGQSASDYTGIGVDEKIVKLAEGFEHANQRGQGTAAIFDLLGRGAATFAPLIAAGGKEIREFMDQVTVASNSTVHDMEKVNEQLELRTQTFKVVVVGWMAGFQEIADATALNALTVMKWWNELIALVTLSSSAANANAKQQIDLLMAAEEEMKETIRKDHDALNGTEDDGLAKRLAAAAALRKAAQDADLQDETDLSDAKKAIKDKEAKEKEYREKKVGRDSVFDTEIAQTDNNDTKRLLERERISVDMAYAVTDQERQRLKLALARIDAEDRKDMRSTLKTTFEGERTMADELIDKARKRLDPRNVVDFSTTEMRRRGGTGGMEGVGFGGTSSAELTALQSQLTELTEIKKGINDVLTKMDQGGALK